MPRRRERFFHLHRDLTPLQPGHKKCGKTRGAPIRLTVVRIDMRPARHFRWIGLREQPLECLETLRFARMNYVASKLWFHIRRMSRGALGECSEGNKGVAQYACIG
jgi:hypothetical protein